jgi:hypothetical protein
MSEESTKITINEKEYEIDSLDEQEKYFVHQVNTLRQRIAEARFNLDQMTAAESQFVNQLVSSVNAKEEEANEES